MLSDFLRRRVITLACVLLVVISLSLTMTSKSAFAKSSTRAINNYQASSQNFTVSSSGQWTDTGIALNVGDALKISATGSWSADPGDDFTGPDGYSKAWPDNFLNLTDIGVCAYCASTLTPYWGALIGYIGSAPPATGSYTSTSILTEAQKVFFVGSNLGVSVARAGELWLNFNDDAYSNNTGDNSGQVTATVTDTSQAQAVWCQCTTFVANYYSLPNTYPNAKDWPAWLSGLGWKQASAPSVGEIVVFQPKFGTGIDQTNGHVGIINSVQSVNNDLFWRITVEGSNQTNNTNEWNTIAGCTNVSFTAYRPYPKSDAYVSYWTQ